MPRTVPRRTTVGDTRRRSGTVRAMPAPLRALAPDLWVADRAQTFYGLPVGTRMTVIRLADGSLLLHSPVELDAGLRAELDAVGRVRYAVAPNRVHHLYAGRVATSYPD